MLQIGPLFQIILFLVIVSPVLAQEAGTRCGFELMGIVESSEGEPLPGASVTIENLEQGVTSDVEGRFKITGLCVGDIRLLVSYVGFEQTRLSVKLPATRTLIIALKPSVKVLHDLIFESTHVNLHDLSQSVDILSDEDLAVHRGKALGEMTRHLSGVTSMNTGPAIFKPVIHGLHSQRILVLNNAVRQEGQQWGVEHAPEIDSYIASELEVVKGAETVRYGTDAIGGVIIVSTPALHYTSGTGGTAEMQFNSVNRMGATSASVEGGLKHHTGIGWRIQGTMKKGGDFATPEYTMSNTAFQEFDGSLTFGVKKSNRSLEVYVSSFNTAIGILRSSHTGNLNDLENSIRNEKPWYIKDFSYSIENPRQKIGHQLLKVKSSYDLGSSTLNVQYASQFNQRKEFDIRRGSLNDKPALSLDLWTHAIDASIDTKHEHWNTSVGINGSFKNNNNVLSTGILPDYRNASGALFGVVTRPLDRWYVELGARIEYQYLQVLTFDSQNELQKPEYNLLASSVAGGTSFKVNEHSRLISRASYSTRPPHTSELYSIGLHHSAGAIEEGLMIDNGVLQNELDEVKQEKSLKWINTFQYTNERFSFEVTGHVNYFSNFVYLSPYDTRLTIRGYFPVFHYQQADAVFAGGEMTTSIRLSKHIDYKLTGSYLYAENTTDDDRLPMIPPAQIDQTLTYSLPRLKKWENIFIRIHIPTGIRQFHAPRTLYPSQITDDNASRGAFDMMPAPSSYTLLNCAMGVDIPWTNQSMTLVFAVDNIFDTTYRTYMNRLRYFSDEPGRNFSMRISYRFHHHHQ